MKWKVNYSSGMDTNDADYVEKSEMLCIFDDTKPDEIKNLMLTVAAIEICVNNFDNGYCDIEDEDFLTDLKSKLSNYKYISEAEIEQWVKDHVYDPGDWFMDFLPDDPNDDSNAHDAYVTFTMIPADVTEDIVSIDTLTNMLNKTKEK